MFKIADASLDWALTHIERQGDTDIFPRPFEFEAIRAKWADVKQYLLAQDLDTWTVRPQRTCLTPKGKVSYRISTQLDPLDSILYIALLYEIGEQLEAARLPIAKKLAFSHRFFPTSDGELFERQWNYTSFQQRCHEILEGDSSVTHVVITDIADFYHRIYHHRVENALSAATGNSDQCRILMKLISRWSNGPSYGIPIGPSPSRLIADLTLDDIDRLLTSKGFIVCRYSDDYRLFCHSELEAHDQLAALADSLFQSHGLTLQPGKTVIVTRDRFMERYLSTPESEELSKLHEQFDKLASLLGLLNPYESVEYDELDDKAKAVIDELNLEDLLREQIGSEDPDLGIVRFVLRRLAQLNDPDIALELVKSASNVYVALAPIVEYLVSLRSMREVDPIEVGEELLHLFESSIVGHLAYHKCWLLMPFATSGQWGQQERLVQIYDGASDSFTRRKATLALGRSGQSYWFWTGRGTALGLQPWERRAFLAGASCLQKDELTHWFQDIKPQLDIVERAVCDWARANPMS
jgi:hypothetical protein